MKEAVQTKGAPGQTEAATTGHVLVVDDDPAVVEGLRRLLTAFGYEVSTAEDGVRAIEAIRSMNLDAVLSDLHMPGLDGMNLLRRVRESDLDLPVILVTGDPSADSAIDAIHFGAAGYLTKPVEPTKLRIQVSRAIKLHELARLRRRAQEEGWRVFGDRAGLEVRFDRALDQLYMVYQPIVRWSDRSVLGWESLVRTHEATFPHPGVLLDAAERLGRIHDLGRRIRRTVVRPWDQAPADALLFVNLHTYDLLDPDLFDAAAPLAGVADRVVLEITERACLEEVDDAPGRVARLRAMGYRIAIDDIGSGYAGLTSFATVEPDILKLDMTLIRDVHQSVVKAKLVSSFASLCEDVGTWLIAEGVETQLELEALTELGCDLFQGYHFARPGAPFPEPMFEVRLQGGPS